MLLALYPMYFQVNRIASFCVQTGFFSIVVAFVKSETRKEKVDHHFLV